MGRYHINQKKINQQTGGTQNGPGQTQKRQRIPHSSRAPRRHPQKQHRQQIHRYISAHRPTNTPERLLDLNLKNKKIAPPARRPLLLNKRIAPKKQQLLHLLRQQLRHRRPLPPTKIPKRPPLVQIPKTKGIDKSPHRKQPNPPPRTHQPQQNVQRPARTTQTDRRQSTQHQIAILQINGKNRCAWRTQQLHPTKIKQNT